MPSETLIITSAVPGIWRILLAACGTWNEILDGRVTFVPVQNHANPDVLICFGTDLTDPDHPNTKARCKRIAPGCWKIRLSQDEKWQRTWWDELLGRGLCTRAFLIHEMGHVFGMPHSMNPDHAMCAVVGGNGRLGRKEKELYRQFLKQVLTDS